MNADHAIPAENVRTNYEASIDVMYGVRFNEMNERFYRRLDSIFSFLSVLGGSAIFASWLGDKPLIAGVLGPAVVVITYIEREVRPAQKAVRCAVQREKFGELASRLPTMDLAAIDKELRLLQSTGPDSMSSLEIPAYNAVMRSHGHTHSVGRVSTMGKVLSLLA
ncbi:hypothetical protein RBI13_18585 [Alcaligenaceae bacterium A4P071]|nr:hypothetical protein [Alcaligenaceae bacterium A4P071]